MARHPYILVLHHYMTANSSLTTFYSSLHACDYIMAHQTYTIHCLLPCTYVYGSEHLSLLCQRTVRNIEMQQQK